MSTVFSLGSGKAFTSYGSSGGFVTVPAGKSWVGIMRNDSGPPSFSGGGGGTYFDLGVLNLGGGGSYRAYFFIANAGTSFDHVNSVYAEFATVDPNTV